MSHADSGGILAAGTTSLPEIVGLGRNYDYRYVWLRDTAMDVSAILRAGGKGLEAERFLDFLCTGRNTNKKDLFVPFYDLDNKTVRQGQYFSSLR
jgi:GH15 family glucan-1,4-alpha-glucosidase